MTKAISPVSESTPRRKHPKEFKAHAVDLARRPEIGFRKAATDLGINESLLRKWADTLIADGGEAFRGHGVRTEHESRRSWTGT